MNLRSELSQPTIKQQEAFLSALNIHYLEREWEAIYAEIVWLKNQELEIEANFNDGDQDKNLISLTRLRSRRFKMISVAHELIKQLKELKTSDTLYLYDINLEIEKINTEIESNKQDENIVKQSPHHAFLTMKHEHLSLAKKAYDETEEEVTDFDKNYYKPKEEKGLIGLILKIFDVIKKPFDLSDDALSFARGILKSVNVEAESLNKGALFLIAIVGLVLHAIEGASEAIEVHELIHDNVAKQRQLKIAMGIVNILNSMHGFSWSVVFLLGASSVAIPLTFMIMAPLMITGSLLAIFINRLNLRNNALHEAIKMELQIEQEYVKLSEGECGALQDSQNNLTQISTRHQNEHKQFNQQALSMKQATFFSLPSGQTIKSPNLLVNLFHQIQENPHHLRKSHERSVKKYLDESNRIDMDNEHILKQCQTLRGKFECRRQNYVNHRNERFDAERQVGFSVIEVVGTLFILIGFATSLVPLVIAGVAITFGGKILENRDEKYNHRPTNAIRKAVVRMAAWVKQNELPTEKEQLHLSPSSFCDLSVKFSDKKQEESCFEQKKQNEAHVIPIKQSNSKPFSGRIFSQGSPIPRHKESMHADEDKPLIIESQREALLR